MHAHFIKQCIVYHIPEITNNNAVLSSYLGVKWTPTRSILNIFSKLIEQLTHGYNTPCSILTILIFIKLIPVSLFAKHLTDKVYMCIQA